MDMNSRVSETDFRTITKRRTHSHLYLPVRGVSWEVIPKWDWVTSEKEIKKVSTYRSKIRQQKKIFGADHMNLLQMNQPTYSLSIISTLPRSKMNRLKKHTAEIRLDYFIFELMI